LASEKSFSSPTIRLRNACREDGDCEWQLNLSVRQLYKQLLRQCGGPCTAIEVVYARVRGVGPSARTSLDGRISIARFFVAVADSAQFNLFGIWNELL
jgi:hypothetical protein